MSRRRLFWAGLVFVAVVTALMTLPWLGLTLFNSKGEPREAIVAVSMLRSGNWILPVSYGGDIPYKPPFVAWLIAIFSEIFNGGVVSEYLSRLPSALAGIALSIACYVEGARAKGPRFGALFALVTATSFEVFRSSSVCRLDMVLTVCIVGAIFLLYEFFRRGNFATLFGAWALMTCATLTKGPVGIILPSGALFFVILMERQRFWSRFGWLCLVAAMSLVLPAVWYYAAYRVGGREFLELAYEENIGRFTGTMSYDSHVKPLWYNFATLALGLLPWTLAVLWFLFKDFKRLKNLTPYKKLSSFAKLSLVSGVFIFVFYSIPESKRSVYLLPMYPFVCYGIAVMLGRYRKAAMKACLVFAGLYVVYSAAIAPPVLNPKSDYHVVKSLKKQSEPIVTYGHDKSERLFTLNYYLDDTLRAIDSPDDAQGDAMVLIVNPEDTTAFQTRGFDTRLLLPRGCDHRRAVYLAVKPLNTKF